MITFNRILAFLFSLLAVNTANAQLVYTAEDSVTIEHLLRQPSYGERGTLFFARQLLNRPYVAHTLEGNPVEMLVVNTRELDCTTLVETVVSLTLCSYRNDTTFAAYCRQLQQLRYRHGRLDGYPSRLHYFSDWIRDNTRKGLIEEVQTPTSPFTAVQLLNINYMSQHPQSYEALRRQPGLLPVIAEQERRLTGLRFRYIPKHNVGNSREMHDAVADGDIIAITTSKAGLDVAHLGFAVWRPDGLHLLNASSIHHKVVIEPMTLGQYLDQHPSFTGIRVIKVLKP